MSKIAFLLAMLLLAFAVTAEESVVESADSDNENDEIDMEQFSLSDDESDDEEDASPEATKAAQDAIDASVADFNDDVKIEDENEQKFIVEGSNEEFTFDGVSAEQIAAWKNDLYHNNAKVEIVSDESPAEAAVSDVEDEHSEDEAVVDDILDEIEKEARANDIAEEDVVEVEELGTNTVVPFSNEAEPEIEEMNEDEATGSQWKPVSTKSGNSWVKCKPARKTASSMTNGKSTKVNTRRVVTGGKGPNVCSRKYDADAATLAELIYRNQRVGSTPYKNYKVITIMNHKSSGSFGGVFVDSKQKLVVLAFRGTEKTSIKDWTVNFNTKKTGCPFGGCGRMHKGFAYSYSTMQAAAYNAVSKYRNQGYSLIITGHSLGGALATTAAMDYANRGGFSSMNIISIGAPRVGDSTFASAYNRKFPCSRRYVLQFRGGKCAIKDDDESEVQDMFFRRATRWVKKTANKVGKSVKKVAKKVATGVKKVAKKVATGVKKVAKKVGKAIVGKTRYQTDLIPRLPPKSFGFKHVKNEVIIPCPFSCKTWCCHKYNLVVLLKCHAAKAYVGVLNHMAKKL